MVIAAIGTTCLGIVFGYLVRYCLYRFEDREFNFKTLSGLSSILFGGAILSLFNWVDPQKNVIWFYPIGLLIGFVIYSLIARFSGANARGAIYYSSKAEDKSSEDNET